MGTTAQEQISFRLMTAQDVQAVALLEQESFADAWNEAALQEMLDSSLGTSLVMLKAGQLIGYAGFLLIAGEAQVTRVAVAKAERGQGWGNVLTAELVRTAWSLGAEAITLEVREHNLAAQRAYLKNGFKSVGVRPNYYEHPREGAVIMWIYK